MPGRSGSRGIAVSRYFLRACQSAGALGRCRARRAVAVDSIVGRGAGSLPRAVGRRLDDHRHQRLGRAGRSGGRAHGGPAIWLAAQPAGVFSRPAEKENTSAGRHAICTARRSASSALAAVGRRVAEVLAPFKTRILATDMFPVDKPAYVESLWPADRLDELLAARRCPDFERAADGSDSLDVRRAATGDAAAGLDSDERRSRAVGRRSRSGRGAWNRAIWRARAWTSPAEEPLPPTAGCGICRT